MRKIGWPKFLLVAIVLASASLLSFGQGASPSTTIGPGLSAARIGAALSAGYLPSGTDIKWGDASQYFRLRGTLGASDTWELHYSPTGKAITLSPDFADGGVTGFFEVDYPIYWRLQDPVIMYQGGTASAETRLYFTDPTGDRDIYFPDASGTVITSGNSSSLVANEANNYVLTSLGANANANAEANLTFDGSTLALTGSQTTSGTNSATGGFVGNLTGTASNSSLLGSRAPDDYSGTAIVPPATFPWVVPFNVFRADQSGEVWTDLDIERYKPTITKTYYVSTTGDDGALGTSGAPLKSVKVALAKPDVDEVLVAPGVYQWGNGWDQTAPARSLSVRRWGSSGDVVLSCSAPSLVWAAEASPNTHVYKATYATYAPKDVWDASIVDGNGDYYHPTVRASIAEVEANIGSYYITGNDIYVRLSDDRAPDSSVRVFITRYNGYHTAATTVYLENLNFEGGLDTWLLVSTSASTKVYAANCTFKYSNNDDGVKTQGGGEAIFYACTAARNYADGFKSTLNTVQAKIGYVSCTSRNNGQTSSTAHNAWSTHDGGATVYVDCEGTACYGPQVADVTTAYSWLVGCNMHDAAPGSGASDVNYYIDGFMWLDTCASSGSTYDLCSLAAGDYLYTYALTTSGTTEGSGTFSAYTPEVPLYYAIDQDGNATLTSITFEGATANDYETTIAVTDPTADRTVTVADASGIVLLGTPLTAATMTAAAGNGSTGTAWHKYTWTAAMVVSGRTAAGASNVKVATLPAKTVVTRAYIITNAAATGVDSPTVSLGRTGAGYIDYVVATAPGIATIIGNAIAEIGTNLKNAAADAPIEDFAVFADTTSTVDVYAQFTCDGAPDIDQWAAATGTVYLETYTLP